MMDHYEEWGLERSASVAEIRQAYRRLMRLVHPDHCKEEASRRLAELQTKRLNAILAILTDPVERERYDRRLSLERASAFPPGLPRLRRSLDWGWAAAITAVALLLLALTMAPRRDAAPVSAVAPVPAAAEAPSKPRPGRATPVMASVASKRLTNPEIASAGGGKSGGPAPAPEPLSLPEEPPPLDPPAWIREPVNPGDAGFIDPPNPPPRNRLAGEWLALPQSRAGKPGLYAPEYIELRVTEASGVVRGKYSARYHVADRAISPIVTFEFEGPAEEDGAHLPWSGPGGSRGEVTLRLVGPRLEVAWAANRMGAELGLISGTATLVRKAD